MDRNKRLRAIRDIITNKKISSQEKLLEELEKEGFQVTQATVSRDIQSLNLVKVRDAEKNEFYALSESYQGDPQHSLEKVRIKFKENVVFIKRANNIIVIKTSPGEAQGVAAVVDGSNFKEILGTVAGDDTIICIGENDKSVQRILELFNSF